MWQSFLDKIQADQRYFQEFLEEAKGYWREDILRVLKKIIDNEEFNKEEHLCFIKINQTNMVRDHKIAYLGSKVNYLEERLSYLLDRMSD